MATESIITDPILEIENLQTYYFLEKGTVKAVDGVTFSVERGSTIGIVGESGSGKSVTARSVVRLIKSPPGQIVGGKIIFHPKSGNKIDLTEVDPRGKVMRKVRGGEISMIFQEPMTSLNPLYTVGDQIAEAVELHQGVGKKEAHHRALEMLRKVHINDPETRVDQYPHQLSGGMRQRVMIALALSCNPAILIADEPTTALDVTVQAQILDLMRQLQHEFDSSIMLITHNLGVVSQMADYVAVMYFGKIVEYGTVRDIFHRPLHPYTEGLLKSIPVLGQRQKLLVPIKGIVPNATEDVQGCSFKDRCPHRFAKCDEQPPLKAAAEGHEVACWLHE